MPPTATLLIPYFGTLPEWFELYALTAGHQESFSWVIFTDDPREFHLPPNVEVRRMSFADYRALVADRLGLPGLDFAPIQLCDLKPFLGFIHQDDIRDSDYWGFADMDLVVGDLGRFLGPDMSRGLDLISTHEDLVAGHLTLLRNTPSLRNRCFTIPRWQDHLRGGRHVSLDEFHFSESFYPLRSVVGWWRAGQVYSVAKKIGLTKVAWRDRACYEMFTTPLSEIEWPDGARFWDHPLEWRWSNGSVTAVTTGQEVPYLHFMNYKSSRWLAFTIDPAIANGKYRPKELPAGCTPNVAPWEALDSIVLNTKDPRDIEWIRIGVRGIEVG